MRYVSTRGQSPAIGFWDAVLAGLAPDGGLYIPEAWPRFLPEEIAAFAGKPYAEVAATMVRWRSCCFSALSYRRARICMATSLNARVGPWNSSSRNRLG